MILQKSTLIYIDIDIIEHELALILRCYSISYMYSMILIAKYFDGVIKHEIINSTILSDYNCKRKNRDRKRTSKLMT